MQISRESTNRRIVIGVNVGSGDVETLVETIQKILDEKVALPPGYYFTYGGQFENLKAAKARLSVAVPIALAMIFVLLFFTFGSVSQAVLIFTAIPLSAIGGVWSLYLRGMPFSISAGIGFIALFGVAVLNGIVLIAYFNQLKKEGVTDIRERIIKGTKVRLRPVLMTAAVASLGFLPMAISTSGGAEVQRPLATVVIGGLITATFLTLVILPILYSWLANWQERKRKSNVPGAIMLILPLLFFGAHAQAQQAITVDEAVEIALQNHPSVKAADLHVQKEQKLQGINYSPGTTDIFYEGDALFKNDVVPEHQVGVMQNFPNPKIQKSRNAVQDELVNISRSRKQLTEAELKMKVKQVYFELQERKDLLHAYELMTEEYRSFLSIASKRVETGAANRVELLTIQTKLGEFELLKKQVELELSALQSQFNLLLNSGDTFTTKDSLKMLPFISSDADSLAFPLAQIARHNVKLQQANIFLIKAERFPGIGIGYVAQRFDDAKWYTGLRAGIHVPLFNNYSRKKAQAQKIRVEAAQQEAHEVAIEVTRQRTELEKNIALYSEGATFYAEQLQSATPELLRVSRLNYQAGEISYLELLNALQLLAESSRNYLQQALAYNKAVLNLQFLSGN